MSSLHLYQKYLYQKVFLWWQERKNTNTVSSLCYYLCMVGMGKEVKPADNCSLGQKVDGQVHCEFDYSCLLNESHLLDYIPLGSSKP